MERVPLCSWAHLRRHPLLTPEQEVELAKRAEAGDRQAKDTLVRCNFRLVESIVERFTDCGRELEDLIQDGHIGLIKAVEAYDWRKGTRFSTYATWWIIQSILREIQKNCRAVYLPANIHDLLLQMRKERDLLSHRLFRQPSAEELADVMELPVEQVEEVIFWEQTIVSLEEKVDSDGEGDSSILKDLIEDKVATDPGNVVIGNNEVSQLLAALTPRQQEIVIKRECEEHDYSKIGKMLNPSVTGSAVREVHLRVMAKLKEQTH